MKISLVLLTAPLLFTGCVQEKVSKVKPTSKDENHTKITVKKSKTLTNISPLKILLPNTNLTLTSNSNPDDLMLDSSILDELALNIQNSMDLDLNGDKKITTQSLEVSENWEAFTREDELLETAKEYLGVPYIWAANGPSAFDCSGYTKYVFKKNGITLPRYSGHQANVGIKVAYNELQKGDLVFFDTAKGFHKKVNHVGIYIGENKFIHASSARKQVMITSFSQKKFYKNRFLHGRRIINSDSSFALYDASQIHRN